uniref:Uncharacterized protein n=1 Tax=Arundo donax TaxID=35708 RepID=A0A0A9HQV4_ARUDO
MDGDLQRSPPHCRASPNYSPPQAQPPLKPERRHHHHHHRYALPLLPLRPPQTLDPPGGGDPPW